MQWQLGLLEHSQHMKQALEAFKYSNNSFDEQSGTEYGWIH